MSQFIRKVQCFTEKGIIFRKKIMENRSSKKKQFHDLLYILKLHALTKTEMIEKKILEVFKKRKSWKQSVFTYRKPIMQETRTVTIYMFNPKQNDKVKIHGRKYFLKLVLHFQDFFTKPKKQLDKKKYFVRILYAPT